MIDLLFRGLGGTDIALALNRVAVGLFFLFSGYHKLFNPERRRLLVNELTELHIPAVRINQWWVPLVEFSAGAAVVIGLFAPLAALGLVVIILIANVTSGRQRIRSYKPVDRADRIDDWLYLPETLYAFMLLVVISAGAGPYSVDSVIVRLIDRGTGTPDASDVTTYPQRNVSSNIGWSGTPLGRISDRQTSSKRSFEALQHHPRALPHAGRVAS
jgi:uncharacterized membrane protein YphA (DoxX/SURF4 family)